MLSCKYSDSPYIIAAVDDVRSAIAGLKSVGWTGAAIADSLNVSWFTVDRWSRGTQAPANGRPVLVALRQLTRRRPPPKRRVTRRPLRPRSPVPAGAEARASFEALIGTVVVDLPPAGERSRNMSRLLRVLRELPFLTMLGLRAACRTPLRALALVLGSLWLTLLALTLVVRGATGWDFLGFALFTIPALWAVAWGARPPPER